MGEMIMDTKFWSKNLNARDHLKNLGIDGKIVFEWLLGK
jgi:hypothetical protein